MSTSKSRGRGFFSASMLAVLVAVTVAPEAKATVTATNLSIKAIGLSAFSTGNPAVPGALAYVTFTTSLTGHVCTLPAGNPGFFRMVFDHTTARGRTIMSLLTAAQLADKKVSVTGNNLCVTQVLEPGEAGTQTETIIWLRVE